MGSIISTKIAKMELAHYRIESVLIDMQKDGVLSRPYDVLQCQHLCQQMHDQYGTLNCDLATISNVSKCNMSIWRRCDNPLNSDIGNKVLHTLQIMCDSITENELDSDNSNSDYDSDVVDTIIDKHDDTDSEDDGKL